MEKLKFTLQTIFLLLLIPVIIFAEVAHTNKIIQHEQTEEAPCTANCNNIYKATAPVSELVPAENLLLPAGIIIIQ